MRLAFLLALVVPGLSVAGPTASGPVVQPVPTPSPWPISFDMTVCSSLPSPPCYLETLEFQRNNTYTGGQGPWGPGSGFWNFYGHAGGVLNLVARDGTVFSGWGVPSPGANQRCFTGVWHQPQSSANALSGTWDGCATL